MLVCDTTSRVYRKNWDATGHEYFYACALCEIAYNQNFDIAWRQASGEMTS